MRVIKKGIGVVGSTTIDEIVSENRSVFKLGGVTTYSGITYSRHGINTSIISNIAQQDQAILNKLQDEKIVVYNGATDCSTHFINYINKAERYQELPCRTRPIKAHQIAAVMDVIDGLHLGPLHPFDIELDASSLLDQSELITLLDVQGYTRKVKNKKVYLTVSKNLSTALRVAQIIKADGAEIETILDFYQLSMSELMLRFRIDEAIVTLGAEGGFVAKQSGEKFYYKAEKIKSRADPTGAGDVFFAAYIARRFSDNRDIPDACRYAAQIAALHVKGEYITTEQLSLTEIV